MNAIPLMTDPLGRYWEQPDLSDVLMDDTHVILTQEQLRRLGEYSTSIPTGVYDGKAWKRAHGEDSWLLGWYGPATNGDPTQCSINFREVLI